MVGITKSMQRIRSWDVVKCIAIFLVVWGHALNAFDLKHAYCGDLYRFIYSFHMPLFMVVSGYFSVSSYLLACDIFLKKKAVQLLLPALSWSLITCAYIAIEGAPVHTVVLEFVGNSWFLKTLFACYVMVYIVKFLLDSDIKAFVLSCIITFMVPGGSFLEFNWLLPFFWLGYFLRKYNNAVLYRKGYILFVAVIIIIALSYMKNIFSLNYFIHIDIDSLMVNAMNLLFSFLWAASISIVIIFAVLKLCKRENVVVKALAMVGRYTLGIYVIQTILLEKFLLRTVHFHIDVPFLYNCIYTPVISCIVIMVYLLDELK